MKGTVLAAVIGVALGVGLFLVWRNLQLPLSERQEIRLQAVPKSEADLKLGAYFDLRDKKEVLITIDHGEFNPRIIIIDKGTKVFWKNTDPLESSININNHSESLAQNKSFYLILSEPGDYQYQGVGQAGLMQGLIVVK